jgi:DNA-binding MarR family transcriptional regulator
VETRLQKLGSRSKNAHVIINYLYQHPSINAQKVKELTMLSLPSAYKLIDDLEGLGIIEEVTGAKRGKQYLFREYINLFS